MRSGLPYLIGKLGPEIFVPRVTGRIETNGALRNLSAAGKVGATALQSSTARGTPLRSLLAGEMVRAGVGEGAAGSKSVRGGDFKVEVAVHGGAGQKATLQAREAERPLGMDRSG